MMTGSCGGCVVVHSAALSFKQSDSPVAARRGIGRCLRSLPGAWSRPGSMGNALGSPHRRLKVTTSENGAAFTATGEASHPAC